MPQAFNNPYSGFASGLSQGTQQGTQMGLTLMKRKETEQKLEAAKKKQQQEVDQKAIEQSISLMSKEWLPDRDKLAAHNAMVKTWNRNHEPEDAIDELEAWPEKGSKYAKRIKIAWEDTELTVETKLQAIRGIYAEGLGAGEKINIADLTKPLEEEQEAANVQQGLDIRALQEDPRFGALTPEQQAQAGAPSAERGLLARGGATGQALLKEGAKPPKPGLEGNLKEWINTRISAGVPTTSKDVAAYLRKGGKTQAETFDEWRSVFKSAMGREPSKEEIGKKLINDPYGILEPAAVADANTAEGYLSKKR